MGCGARGLDTEESRKMPWGLAGHYSGRKGVLVTPTEPAKHLKVAALLFSRITASSVFPSCTVPDLHPHGE